MVLALIHQTLVFYCVAFVESSSVQRRSRFDTGLRIKKPKNTCWEKILYALEA